MSRIMIIMCRDKFAIFGHALVLDKPLSIVHCVKVPLFLMLKPRWNCLVNLIRFNQPTNQCQLDSSIEISIQHDKIVNSYNFYVFMLTCEVRPEFHWWNCPKCLDRIGFSSHRSPCFQKRKKVNLTFKGTSWLMIIGSIYWLIGGLEHFFHFIYGMSSLPLTNSIIFQDGYCTTNQHSFRFGR